MTKMNYSEDYADLDRDWEDLIERAQDHLERLLAELVSDIPKLGDPRPYPNCTAEWYTEAYLRKIDQAKDIAKMIGEGDAWAYGERFIGDLSENGDY